MPRYCTRCLLPDDRPGVVLDAEGVCNGCRNVAGKVDTIDWERRGAEFREVVAHAKSRSSGYDCVIPVSGGKDSFWQVVTCLEHGLRPLAVNYVPEGVNPHGVGNLHRLGDIGVDLIEYRINPDVQRRFVAKAFTETAISGLPLHMAIWAIPARVAVAFGIPLVVYGENPAFEYGSEDESLTGARMDEAWLKVFGVTNGTTAADWVCDELSPGDLTAYTFPDAAKLEAADLRTIFLGYYKKWSPETARKVAEDHGFESRAEGAMVGHWDFVNIDDEFIAVHHHPKWHKFGINRSFDTLSIDIRNGELTRTEALKELRRRGAETPWPAISHFCEYLGWPVSRYAEVVERFRNTDIWEKRDGRWVIPGFILDDFEWPTRPGS